MKHTIFPNTEKIDFSKKLKFKFGVDPTSDKLHLGHLIPLLLLKKLWIEGHDVDIVLGTFTAQLGDPSGKDTMRPILTAEETERNTLSVIDQLYSVFFSGFGEKTKGKLTMHRNSTWFSEMSAIEMTNILSKFTTAQLLSRDSFQKRIKDENPIGMHELVVPILQGFDSVHLKSDVEIGGTDQLFNFSISRDMQRLHGQEPEKCILMPIINGTDGRKMSKSFGNCIFLTDTPKDVFGKAMSISDELMKEWWPILNDSEFPAEKHPMSLKKDLAWLITKEIWSDSKADEELKEFERVIQEKAIPKDIQEIKLPLDGGVTVLSIVTQVRNCSKNEARRLIDGNGVRLITEVGDNTVLINGDMEILTPGAIIKVGKRSFAKLV